MKFFKRSTPAISSSAPTATTVSNNNDHDDHKSTMTTAKVVPAGPAPKVDPDTTTISHKLALGAGCFWGVEKYVVRDFQKKFPGSINVASTKVGFMSPLSKPRIQNPTYRQVCTGTSGHVEVLYVELTDPAQHFEELCRFFFTFHDPTLKDRQGNDVGFQYSSWIFTDGEEQYRIAQKVKNELQAALDAKVIPSNTYTNATVETRLAELSEFTVAGQEHQQYLAMNPNGYCNHRIRLKKWYEIKG